MKFKLWDRQEILYTPAGRAFTPAEIFAQFPLANNPASQWIIQDDEINMGMFQNLSMTKGQLIDQGMEVPEGATNEEVLQCIENWYNRKPENPVTVEERIAAAMEFQNAMML